MKKYRLIGRAKEGRIKGLKIIERFGMENETKANKYWLNNEEKKCRIFKKEGETAEHIFEIWYLNWKEEILGRKEKIASLYKVIRLRERGRNGKDGTTENRKTEDGESKTQNEGTRNDRPE